MLSRKEELLREFFDQAESIVKQLLASGKGEREQSALANTQMRVFYERKIKTICQEALQQKWQAQQTLNEVLYTTYAFYITLLECRNRVWKYDYMAFARRVGELWESFCTLVFDYSPKKLLLIDPPDFIYIRDGLKKDAYDLIDSLNISDDDKRELKRQYEIPWTMIDSGGINLELDLHFEQNGINYNCDFKSGFSSNEKGNTNRLLLIGSIYHTIGEKEKTLLFVMRTEKDNNSYLATLNASPYWDVYCAEDCYSMIHHFTGFDLRSWIDNNVNWEKDFTPEFWKQLCNLNITKYLEW